MIEWFACTFPGLDTMEKGVGGVCVNPSLQKRHSGSEMKCKNAKGGETVDWGRDSMV